MERNNVEMLLCRPFHGIPTCGIVYTLGIFQGNFSTSGTSTAKRPFYARQIQEFKLFHVRIFHGITATRTDSHVHTQAPSATNMRKPNTSAILSKCKDTYAHATHTHTHTLTYNSLHKSNRIYKSLAPHTSQGNKIISEHSRR